MTVLVIGEALLDIFSGIHVPGSATSGEESTETVSSPGGSPLNVAVGLARLGRKTQLLTRIGSDAFGEKIIAHCRQAGVTLMPGSVTGEPTSTATATLRGDGSANYDFRIVSSYPHPPQDSRSREKLLANPPAHLHFGSLGAHLKPGNTAVREWIEFYRGSASISYDPNVRLQVTGSPAKMRAEITSLLPLIHIFKASAEDLSALYGNRPASETARELLDAGVLLVAVTAGKDGLRLFTRQHEMTIPAAKATVVDTVGAGDSLMSALIDGLGRISMLGAEDVKGLLRISKAALVSLGSYCATAAGITVTRRGANPPTRKEIAAYSEKYSVGAL